MKSFTAVNDELEIIIPSSMRNGTIGAQISGTFVGTIEFQITLDEQNWVAASFRDPSDDSTKASFTAPGIGIIEATSLRRARLLMTAFTSGEALGLLIHNVG